MTPLKVLSVPASMLWVAAACGRVGFQPVGDGATTDAMRAPDDGLVTATWSLLQAQGTIAGVLPVNPTTAGTLVVVVAEVQLNDTLSSVTDDAPGGSSTYVAIPSARAVFMLGGDEIDVWFTASARAGATHITATSSGGPSFVYSTGMWEVSGLVHHTVDTAAALSDQPSTTLPLGPTITPAAPGEFIVAAEAGDGPVSGMASGNEFTFDNVIPPSGNGWAHLAGNRATMAPHHAQWSAGAGAYESTSIAFGP